MQNLNSWPPLAGGRTYGDRLGSMHGGALTAANARAKALLEAHAEASERTAHDPRGQHLRRLREQQHVDPATLASRACISLRQLYQLETGETSLFYSPSLRNQAGRRVAQLLGVEWESLGTAKTGSEPE